MTTTTPVAPVEPTARPRPGGAPGGGPVSLALGLAALLALGTTYALGLSLPDTVE